MIQADLLEQSYSMFTALHNVGRHKKTIYPKLFNESTKQIFDPNQFQIQSISAKVSKYESIWENKAILSKVENELGYSLEYKTSSLDHPCILYIMIAAGKGVFLKCPKKKYVLPGTLLGFFPGTIYDSATTMKVEENREYPYLKRYDGLYIKYLNETLPYPVKPGICIFYNYLKR